MTDELYWMRGQLGRELRAGHSQQAGGGLRGQRKDHGVELIGGESGGDDPAAVLSLNGLHGSVGGERVRHRDGRRPRRPSAACRFSAR